MPRPGVTAEFATALAAKVIRPCFLVRLQFISEVLNIWSGHYPLQWSDLTWYGAGTLLSITGMSEESEVVARGVTITLSGLPSDLISLMLTEYRRGLAVQIYLGLFRDDGKTLIPDPVLAYIGRMDQPTLNDAGETCTIAVNAESRLVDMNRSVYRRYTDADQQLDYPGDLGCAFVQNIQEQQIFFGSLPQSRNN